MYIIEFIWSFNLKCTFQQHVYFITYTTAIFFLFKRSTKYYIVFTSLLRPIENLISACNKLGFLDTIIICHADKIPTDRHFSRQKLPCSYLRFPSIGRHRKRTARILWVLNACTCSYKWHECVAKNIVTTATKSTPKTMAEYIYMNKNDNFNTNCTDDWRNATAI